ncbi:hypothetical protein L1O03_11295 [Corynebacterium uropygiale]|uniref:Uncharacterized protein n=1 Tax=Corynebacterium uropygiale TaxID=1775911 RepID=A0A9X1QR23_9CORY|nr:hypothetical protein [Corynebacterium uropygiale]MCF4007749.1 hypothetical protein [Corynebacterium uropygiale]
MKTTSWSFYGKSQPRWMVALAWVLIFLLPAVAFISLRYDWGYQLLFIYALIAGLIQLVLSWCLRSWLLILIGLFTLTFYYYMAGLLFGIIP